MWFVISIQGALFSYLDWDSSILFIDFDAFYVVIEDSLQKNVVLEFGTEVLYRV